MADRPIRLLFVCVENANRSQMAQAFARIHGGEQVEVFNAGSPPLGKVSPKAIDAMKHLGYDLTTHESTSLDDLPDVEFDVAVTMGCGDACPFVAAISREDWQIPDPREMPPEEFRNVRDPIGRNVKTLIESLG